MKQVCIYTIPHHRHRYPTIGDWMYDQDGLLVVEVSDLNNEKAEICVAIHELVEALLCKAHGITQKQVDEFDVAYEAQRAKDDDTEPGDDPNAPYYYEHVNATMFERMMARMLGLDWEEYGKIVDRVFNGEDTP